jgi:hypothetical protein
MGKSFFQDKGGREKRWYKQDENKKNRNHAAADKQRYFFHL